MIKYSETKDASGRSLSLVAYAPKRDVPLLVADSTHPHYSTILARLANDDESVFELFDVGTGIAKKFEQVSERVSFDGSNILFDGDPVHSVLTDQLKRALEEGLDDYKPLALFWEKLESNPNEHSRRQTYDWLAAHKFQITEDGDVVGYKGVVRNLSDGTYKSTTTSRVAGVPSAFVNGLPLPEKTVVTQNVGDVVTLPRSEVSHDPGKFCDRGLHVGTYAYAKQYGNTVFEVHVNPRDFVSVPNDARGEKVRVNRYKVHAVVTAELTGGVVVSKTDSTYDPRTDVSAKV
jgi:hypothetical protein